MLVLLALDQYSWMGGQMPAWIALTALALQHLQLHPCRDAAQQLVH